MKHNTSAIVGFVFVVFVASLIALASFLNKRDAAPAPVSNPNARQQDIGSSETIIEYTDHYSYTVFYPTIDKKGIDSDIWSLVQSFLSEFEDQYDDYVAPSLDERATLTVTYDAYLTGGRILSLVFLLEDYNPKSSSLTPKVRIVNYDLNGDARLKMEDYFTPSYWDAFAESLKNYLGTVPEYDPAFVERSFSSSNAEFDANPPFFFTNSGVTLCLEVPNKDTGELELVELAIPASVLLPVITQNPFPSTPPAQVAETSDAANEGSLVTVASPPPIDPEQPMVALTFDDGPHAKVTNHILDVLEENQSRATFFVLGSLVKKEKETIRRALSLGCQIGNHSYSHKSLPSLNKKDLKLEVEKTNTALKKIVSQKAEILRPPFGSVNSQMRKNLAYPFIHWSIDTMDWKTKSKKKTVKSALEHIRDGDIVLMHDLHESTAEACETIVPKLIQDGYQLVTVNELFESKGIKLKSGKSYYSARR